MADNGSHKRESAALALARGMAIRATAAQCDISERTIYRWLEDDVFRHRISELRTTIFDQVVGRLAKISGKATIVLAKLLDSDDERIRLAAAKTVLETSVKTRDNLEQAQRLDDMEKHLRGTSI